MKYKQQHEYRGRSASGLFFFSPGYLIVHFIHFLFALVFVYAVVLPIRHGRTLSMLYNLGIVV